MCTDGLSPDHVLQRAGTRDCLQPTAGQIGSGPQCGPAVDSKEGGKMWRPKVTLPASESQCLVAVLSSVLFYYFIFFE